jgi:hypothetical protein
MQECDDSTTLSRLPFTAGTQPTTSLKFLMTLLNVRRHLRINECRNEEHLCGRRRMNFIANPASSVEHRQPLQVNESCPNLPPNLPPVSVETAAVTHTDRPCPTPPPSAHAEPGRP